MNQLCGKHSATIHVDHLSRTVSTPTNKQNGNAPAASEDILGRESDFANARVVMDGEVHSGAADVTVTIRTGRKPESQSSRAWTEQSR